MSDPRIHNRWPIAREGLPFICGAGMVTALFWYMGLMPIAILAGVIGLFIVFFFRDPERKNTPTHNAVLTPADGTILKVQELAGDENALGEPAVKISIFMSVFNVHVNRIPMGGTVKRISYRPGKFFSANLDKASALNECNKIILETPDSRTIAVIQIAGLIARRISCWVTEGDAVAAGQRFGLIRFGSRLEVFLPQDSRIIAKVRQKVKAGQTIIGYLP